MPRRVSLPQADDLFRPTHDGEPPVSGQASTVSRAMITHSTRSPLAKSILSQLKSA